MQIKWRRNLVWTLIGVLIIGGLVYVFLPDPVPVDLATVTRGDLRVTVDEEGRTRVKELYVVSAPLAGRALRIRSKVGDIVTADMKHQIEMEARRRTQQLLQDSDRTVETAKGDDPENQSMRQQAEQVDTASGGDIAHEIEQQQSMTEIGDRSETSTEAARHRTVIAAETGNEKNNVDGE